MLPGKGRIRRASPAVAPPSLASRAPKCALLAEVCGAAALIVASEAAARRHGLTPIACVLGGAVAGLAPRIMGMGPAPASRKLMARLGLGQADFDVIDLNEALPRRDWRRCASLASPMTTRG